MSNFKIQFCSANVEMNDLRVVTQNERIDLQCRKYKELIVPSLDISRCWSEYSFFRVESQFIFTKYFNFEPVHDEN